MVFSSANAWSWGDEENIVTLAKLDESSASFSVVFRDAQKPDEPPRAWVRRVRREDLAESHRINNLFQAGDADVFAGSTFMHLSAAAFNELKSKGETAMVLGTMTDADYEGLRKMQDSSAQANFMFPLIASR